MDGLVVWRIDNVAQYAIPIQQESNWEWLAHVFAIPQLIDRLFGLQGCNGQHHS